MSDEHKPKPPRASRPEFPVELPSRPHHESRTQPHESTRLDEQLRRYLEEHERDKSEGNTIGNLRNEVRDVKVELHQTGIDVREVATEQRLMRLRLDRHGREIRALKEKVFHADPDEMDTGVHQVQDLKNHLAAKELELKERRDSTWWRRSKIQWAVAAIAATLTMSIGGLGTVLWYVLTHGGK
jgi:uncharacterized protein (UPF0335 family)